MNNIHPTLCLGHLQGTRASSSSAIIAIYVRFLLPSLWDNLWSLTFVQSLVLFYVLSFVEWDQNEQAVAKETDHRIIKKIFIPPLVQYPKKKTKSSLLLEFRQMTGSCLSSGSYTASKGGSPGYTAKNGQMERGYVWAVTWRLVKRYKWCYSITILTSRNDHCIWKDPKQRK